MNLVPGLTPRVVGTVGLVAAVVIEAFVGDLAVFPLAGGDLGHFAAGGAFEGNVIDPFGVGIVAIGRGTDERGSVEGFNLGEEFHFVGARRFLALDFRVQIFLHDDVVSVKFFKSVHHLAAEDHLVEFCFEPRTLRIISTGTYGRRQFKELAAIPGAEFPPPLLDRMEVIRLSGYTEDEKVNIAQRYLLPKQMKANGLKREELSISETALRDVVRYHTREAGVRGLEREISKVCRKVVKTIVLKSRDTKVAVTPRNLDRFLGVRRYTYGVAEKHNQIGQVTGLAWTEVGGELLTIEAVVLPGKGKTITTGKLGEVMQESVQAALSVVRKRSAALGIQSDFHQQSDLHIHLPEGATPKDGPSAGIGVCTAIVSVLTGIPVRADVAMTGEITLRGEVLPIGGLKEKLLAAHRGGIKTVLIPEENVKDLADIADNIKNRLEIVPVKWIDQVLDLALERRPDPLPEPVPLPAAIAPVVDEKLAQDVTKH